MKRTCFILSILGIMLLWGAAMAAADERVDAQNGSELATFEDQETGYRGATSMETLDDLFPHQAKSLGENIGDFIQRLY